MEKQGKTINFKKKKKNECVKREGVLCSRKKTAGGAVLRSTLHFIILLNKLLFNV
jgi:hypothetical protein